MSYYYMLKFYIAKIYKNTLKKKESPNKFLKMLRDSLYIIYASDMLSMFLHIPSVN